ncbi:MAG: type I-E CRISPR-associated endonuclease Cas1 [Alphaproteobacteria bacterium]|nr:type I-E CRISPR-associated endonuclease Cas1 [Alphaproteobacteria bacterium]
MLKGRLGLDGAEVPHRDRHGLVWLSRGGLTVTNGTLQFTTAGEGGLEPGVYDLPYQMVSCLLLGPGSTVSHDALRIMARHGTGFVAVGSDGVRMYASSMPGGPDRSKLARSHAALWADESRRLEVARRMFAIRFGEDVGDRSLNQLRGIEAARVKAAYKMIAARHGIQWSGRRYDRAAPTNTDDVNQAINHASTALLAAAKTAVAIAGAVPQLGFVHEDSGWAFCLDLADLYRESVALEGAFEAVRQYRANRGDLERLSRVGTGRLIRRVGVIPGMIDRMKELLE